MNVVTNCSTRRRRLCAMLAMIATCVLICAHAAMAQSGVSLALVKTNNAPMPVPSGQIFTYTLTYSYSGASGFPGTPGTLVIRDTLPSSLEVVSATSGASITGQIVTFTLSGLTSTSGAGTVQINVRFWPGITCPQTVACNVGYLSVQGDTVQVASNQSCAMATAANKWMLWKTYLTGCLVDSGDVVYYITVYNPANNDIGGLNLTNVQLADILPPGAIITSVSPYHPGEWNAASPTSGTAIFSGGPTNMFVESGPRWYGFYLHVRFPGGIFTPGQPVTNTARLVFQTPCSHGQYDTMYATANNVLCGPVPMGTIRKDFGLRVSFPDNPWYTPTWAPGCCGNYVIVYQNTSGLTQSSVEINDTLPSTVDVSSMDVIWSGGATSVTVDIFYATGPTCSPTPGATTTLLWGMSYSPPPGNICHIRWRYAGSISPGGNVVTFVNVCMRSASFYPPYTPVVAGQPVINTACASGTNVPANLCATRNDPVMPSAPNVLAAKFFEGLAGPCTPPTGPGCSRTTAGPYYAGDTVRFRMVVANVGNVSATSCTITDALPSGFHYVSGGETYYYGSLSGGAASFNWPTCCMLTPAPPTIPLGGSLTIPSTGDTHLTWIFPTLPATCGGDIDYLVIEFNVQADLVPPVPPGNYFNTFTFSATNMAAPVVSSTAEVTINGTAQVQCEKEVRPDIGGAAFSSSANVQQGSVAEYRLRIRNTGSMTLTNVYLLDIMPHTTPPDVDVLPLPAYGLRGSQFDMGLGAPMTGGVGGGFTDAYNSVVPATATMEPSRTPLFCSSPPNPGGAVAGTFGPWGSVPGPFTYSFQVTGVASPLGWIAPGVTQDFFFKATVPNTAPIGMHACNSFGLQVIPQGTTTCMTVNSSPACVTAIEPDHNQCTSIWDKVKFDDCCGFSISVLNTLGSISRLDYNVLPIGGGGPSGVVQSIVTSPCLPTMMIPATLPASSGSLIYTPPCGSSLNVNLHASSTTPSGQICIELIATLVDKRGRLIQCRDTLCFVCDPAPKVRCDSMFVRAFPNGNMSMRTFTIVNMKSPVSPICSVKITLTPSPGASLYGDGLLIDGVAHSWPAGTSMGYTMILPIHGLPATSTVQFNLGVPYGIGWSGNVDVKVYHCDEDSCDEEYGPWVASTKDTISVVTPTPVIDPGTLHMHSLDFSTATAAGLHVRSVAVYYDVPVTEIVAVTGATYPCEPNAQANCNDIFAGVHVKDQSIMFDLRRDLDDPANLNDPIATVLYRSNNDDDPIVRVIYYDENGQEVGHNQFVVTPENPPNRIVSGLDGGDRIAAMLDALTAHPNPTTGRCDLGFKLPSASTVDLDLLDMNGNKVATVITGEHIAAGEHHRTVDLSTIPSGSYLVSLRVNGVPSVLRVELTK